MIIIYFWITLSPVQRDVCMSDARKAAFEYLTRDSVTVNVYECLDATGRPDGYTAHVATPVCENRLCYDAELDMYWDVLGNFSHFVVAPDKPLTKRDHVPFEATDYDKLQQILSTKRPSFIHLRREELVAPPAYGSTSDADALTGATATEVIRDMVGGAVFTCYTLWHIANGGISFEIRQSTSKKLDEQLIGKLLKSPRAEIHYFLVEHIQKQYFSLFLHEFLALAERYDAFFADRLLDNLPVQLLKERQVQNFFMRHFDRLEYASQNALLAKLGDGVSLTMQTLESLIEQVQPHNAARNDQIIRLVCDAPKAYKSLALEKLMDHIIDQRIPLSAKGVGLLVSHASIYPALNKQRKRIERISVYSVNE